MLFFLTSILLVTSCEGDLRYLREDEERTLVDYATRVASYSEGADILETPQILNDFSELLTPGDRVLEIGAGSGRDAAYLFAAGYRVTALEPVKEFESVIRKKMNDLSDRFLIPLHQFDLVRTRVQDFQSPSKTYGGIYALASLIHIPAETEVQVFKKISDWLKPRGIFAGSYLYGAGDRPDSKGRLYRGHDEKSFSQMIAKVPELKIVQLQKFEAMATDGNSYPWLNVVLKKLTRGSE